MRTLCFLLFAFLLILPTQAQESSLLGVQLGEPLSQAEEQLEQRAESMQHNDSDFAYVTEFKVEGRIASFSAVTSDFESRSEAKVQEINASLHEMDASPQEVKEMYNDFKKRWSEAFGSNSPRKVNSTYYWTWETDSIEASITYSEHGGLPHSVDLSLSAQ